MSQRMKMDKEILNSLLDYTNGCLYWKSSRGRHSKAGDRAGSKQPNGYRKICVSKKMYQEHRIIWMWHYGEIPENMEVDHIDRDPSNNKIENLRILDRSRNCLNNSANNVSFRSGEKSKPYQGRFRKNYKEYTKYFETYEEAREWVVNSKNSLINGE